MDISMKGYPQIKTKARILPMIKTLNLLWMTRQSIMVIPLTLKMS